MYEPKIRKGVRGSALDMCCLSESMVDRAVFNACTEVVLGREVRTDEEFSKVAEWKTEREDRIVEALEKFGLIDVNKEKELVKLERFVKGKLKEE